MDENVVELVIMGFFTNGFDLKEIKSEGSKKDCTGENLQR